MRGQPEYTAILAVNFSCIFCDGQTGKRSLFVVGATVSVALRRSNFSPEAGI
jgi:hypothetical protein